MQPVADEPPVWERPRFAERRDGRLAMVSTQIEQRGIKDEAVLDAMRQVPRHLFVPEEGRAAAYADRPLPIGLGQTISQPYIVAYMTDLLQVKPGDRLLEVGTGSGYQAAVLSELTPHVYSIEIISKLADAARKRLKELGYETVQVKVGDGYYGWEEQGPFDGIIVTAAAGHVPPPLVQQLKPGGRMVIPVGGVLDTQHLTVVTKSEEGRVHTRSVLPVRFVPMTGRVQSGR
ncbi:MAG: protein-L-isoaspartate O-methyltransferase [Planctomycetes bacterium SM23_32]|nr:MAG: protein-L-isoaspartate O-methyltransferase [Planctomycetes bacterium SM23_32]